MTMPPPATIIRSVLESEKYEQFEVVEAANGAECLRAFDERSPFDLVLLDVNLPDVDGCIRSAARCGAPTTPCPSCSSPPRATCGTTPRAARPAATRTSSSRIARASPRSMASLFTSIGAGPEALRHLEPSDESS